MKQYVPLEQINRGIKIWECVDSLNGCVFNLQFYTGWHDGGVREHGLNNHVLQASPHIL